MNTISDLNQKQQEKDLNSVAAEIRKVNEFFAESMGKGNAAAVATCYTIDGEFMAPGAPSVQGRANIETALAGFIAEGFTEYAVLSATPFGVNGVVGVQAAYTLSQPGGKNKDIGKSIQLWKQEDGNWKIFRDCFNSDLTA